MLDTETDTSFLFLLKLIQNTNVNAYDGFRENVVI